EPGAARVVTVAADDLLEHVKIGGSNSTVGTGGAQTKVSAAKLANASGIPVLLTSTANVANALEGQDVGTWFEPVKVGQ
ncbi:MAG: glutamate 5-kinase, partial [Micrococcales bacterium]